MTFIINYLSIVMTNRAYNVSVMIITLSSLIQGTEVALVVNNLGGTSNLELSIMAGSAINYLST